MRFARRSFARQDIDGLNKLYQIVFNRRRTIRQFEWEWLATPEGEGSICILEDVETGAVIGHYGFIPIKLSYWGEGILSGKGENLMIHPQYRGQGGFTLLASWDRHGGGGDRFPLVWWTTGAPRGQRTGWTSYTRFGAVRAGMQTNYVKITSREALYKLLPAEVRKRTNSSLIVSLCLVLSRLSGEVYLKRLAKKGSTGLSIELRKITDIATVAAELDALWDATKENLGITIERSAEYLRWRVFDNPNLGHDFFVAVHRGRTVGYVITKVRESGAVRLGTIVDVLAEGNDEVLLNTILNSAVKKLEEQHIYVVNVPTLMFNNAINRALKKSGFISLAAIRQMVDKTERLLIVRPTGDRLNTKELTNPDNWYYTEIFTEGLATHSNLG